MNSSSRLLITCRHPLAALADAACPVRLDPLPPAEAALYLREHPGLSKMVFGTDGGERAICDFLVDFSTHCGAEKVHVIAHSMGNRGLLRALQRIATNAEARGQVKFGQIFLAAPDVDRDLFLDLAHLYPAHSERTTLYASAADKAVYLSAKLHDAPRAGYFAPYTIAPGVDTVAVPGFDIDLLGHGYFAQAEALLHDIYDLMRHNQAPAQRQRLAPAGDEGASFWELRH